MKESDWNFLPRSTDEDTVLHSTEVRDADLKQILRELGMKVTPQRLVILKALQKGRRHVTALELYELVSPMDSAVGFATVYRFLRDLTEKNYLTEVRMGGFPARYEITPRAHHDHLTCTRCGKICEFENKSIEALQLKVAEQCGFTLTHHILELFGLCSACQSVGHKIRSRE